MAFVYGLISTRNNKIRYVGETDRALQTRFLQHKRDAGRRSFRVYHWITLERWCGYDIEQVVLAECLPSESPTLQDHWINSLPRQDLVNERCFGNRDILTATERAQVEKIRCIKRDFIENHDGWTGVRYHPNTASWSVSVQAANRVFFNLYGDDPILVTQKFPIQSGRRCPEGRFGGQTEAIIARDNARGEGAETTDRRWRSIAPWPPDNCDAAVQKFCDNFRFERPLYDELVKFSSLWTAKNRPASEDLLATHIYIKRVRLLLTA